MCEAIEAEVVRLEAQIQKSTNVRLNELGAGHPVVENFDKGVDDKIDFLRGLQTAAKMACRARALSAGAECKPPRKSKDLEMSKILDDAGVAAVLTWCRKVQGADGDAGEAGAVCDAAGAGPSAPATSPPTGQSSAGASSGEAAPEQAGEAMSTDGGGAAQAEADPPAPATAPPGTKQTYWANVLGQLDPPGGDDWKIIAKYMAEAAGQAVVSRVLQMAKDSAVTDMIKHVSTAKDILPSTKAKLTQFDKIASSVPKSFEKEAARHIQTFAAEHAVLTDKVMFGDVHGLPQVALLIGGIARAYRLTSELNQKKDKKEYA
eukprot:3897437-Pyramimonas_sp.AAC.1